MALIVSGLIVLAVGENPLRRDRMPWAYGAFGDRLRHRLHALLRDQLHLRRPRRRRIAFHAGLFNIGGEGQAYIGGLGVILVGAAVRQRHCPVA